MLIDRRDLVSAAVLALGLVVEEFAVVRNILYPAVRGLLNTLVVDHPRDVWRRLADDLHVEVERLVLAYGYVAQISPIDLGCDWMIKR